MKSLNLCFRACGLCAIVLAGCSQTITESAQMSGVSQEKAPPAQRTETIPGTQVTFDLVWIDEGGFWIGKTEVTWDEYLAFCAFEGDPPEGRDAISRPSKPLEVAPPDRHWGYGKQPAVGMSWNGAKKYCEWLSLVSDKKFRLPTETEWRLAARETSPLEKFAWFEANSKGQAHEVATLAPTELGLHDTLGNLWEYCANPYAEDQPKRAVLRGGSWKDGPDRVTPDARLRFDNDWTLDDPSFPPGVWWVPDGDHLGMRVLLEAPGP